MKRCFALTLLSVFAAARLVCADGLDDQYVQTFNLIQQADAVAAAEPQAALAKYQQAQAALQQIRKENPNWNALIVNFRLQYVAGKIAGLASKVPAETPSPPGTNHSPPAVSAPAPAVAAAPQKPVPPEDWQEQLANLQQQVQQLRGLNGELEAKLKEAFAARPAETDPREVAQLKKQVSDLQKENALLKVTLNQQSPAAPATPAAPAASLKQTEQNLADANRQLEAAREENTKLKSDNQTLEAQVRANGSGANSRRLQAENQRLREQLGALQAPARTATAEPTFTPLPAGARSELGGAASAANESTRVQQLERERDELQRRLEAAEKTRHARNGNTSASTRELQQLLDAASARLAVYEARAVPYTPQELALMKTPAAALPAGQGDNAVQSVHQLSPESAKLVAQGRHYYQAGDFDRAESTYSQVLREDSDNVAVLTDLASIQVRANHLDAADTHIRKALMLAPSSPYALSVLGRLRLAQGRYDEALDALSRAAKLAPDDPEIENFLGLALSHKGLRAQAENALRKAIELQPDYADAHNNLAVIYITAKPPAVALARWHYQHALSAGAPRNPELENLLQKTH
jgi:Flp pilus assembly protein TadD